MRCEECGTSIEKGTPRTIPIHHEGVDAHVAGTLNLLAQNVRVLAVIANVDVVWVAEPRLVVRENLGIARRGRDILERDIPRTAHECTPLGMEAQISDIGQESILIEFHPRFPALVYDETAAPRVGSKQALSRVTSRLCRDFLEIANVPAICAGGHENDVVVGRILRVEQLVSVEGLNLQLGLVDELHGGPIGGIKHCFQMVPMIDDSNVHARLLLLGNSLNKAIFRNPTNSSLDGPRPDRSPRPSARSRHASA